MPGEIALLCPMDRQDAVELSRTLWRKQVLPRGTIDYKGRRITFDEQYLTDLASAFRGQAFDQVAFLLAKDDNSHTMDPERYRGEVKGVEVTPAGLDVLLDLTPDAAQLVKDNPKLGVSARIIEGLERADGQKFPKAIQHVLGTLDPRVTGMASWQEVSLSTEVVDTVDITNEEVQVTTTVPTTTPTEDPPAPVHPEPRGLTPAAEDALAEEELARLAAADLSGSSGETVDLVAAQSASEQRIRELEQKLARSNFTSEMRVWIDQGVPPAIVQLARPILELPRTPVIDLSNDGGEVIDVAEVIRSILTETKGFIQLAMERGHSFQGDSEEERADTILASWKVS
jgi:hypothetical protein